MCTLGAYRITTVIKISADNNGLYSFFFFFALFVSFFLLSFLVLVVLFIPHSISFVQQNNKKKDKYLSMKPFRQWLISFSRFYLHNIESDQTEQRQEKKLNEKENLHSEKYSMIVAFYVENCIIRMKKNW